MRVNISPGRISASETVECSCVFAVNLRPVSPTALNCNLFPFISSTFHTVWTQLFVSLLKMGQVKPPQNSLTGTKVIFVRAFRIYRPNLVKSGTRDMQIMVLKILSSLLNLRRAPRTF